MMNENTEQYTPEEIISDYEYYIDEIVNTERLIRVEEWTDAYIRKIIIMWQKSRFTDVIKQIVTEYKNFAINDKQEFADIMTSLLEIVTSNTPNILEQLQEFQAERRQVKENLKALLVEQGAQIEELCTKYGVDKIKCDEALSAYKKNKQLVQEYVDSVASSLSEAMELSLKEIPFDISAKAVARSDGQDFIEKNTPKLPEADSVTEEKSAGTADSAENSDGEEKEPTPTDIEEMNNLDNNVANGLI